MALNKEVFRVRATSALFFVIIMLAGLLWNHWSFLLLFSIIHFGCWWEYLNLTERIHKVKLHLFLRFGLMLMGFAIMLSFCGRAYAINGYGIKQNLCLPFLVSGFVLLVAGIFQKNIFSLKAFTGAALGWLYISLSWGMMVGLRNLPMPTGWSLWLGAIIPIILIASIWINDTMAYIVGSFIGKTPFSKISPKKTWEGTIGGAILAIVVVTTFCSGYLHWDLTFSLAIPAIAAVVGTLGDLLESKIKRMADVKDSGSMMPGHGGFMDRFDSLLLATPFVWLLMMLLLQR